MPLYQFKCDKCNIINEFKLSLLEHEKLKSEIYCEHCNDLMIQMVSPLNFRLKGEGWFQNGYGDSSSVENPYSITQRELDKNIDTENRIEDIANNYSEKE